jgi:two-component system sensor histidine kinase DegS
MIINTSLKITNADAVTLYLVADKNTDEWSSITNGNYEDKIMRFVISKNMSIITNLQSFTTPITKQSIYGYTAINGKALRIDNTYSISPEMEYKHDNSFDIKTGYKTVSMLSVPMKDRNNNVTGVIQLINKKKEKGSVDYRGGDWIDKIIPFDYFDELTMNSIAGQAAVALDNNLLYKNINELLEKYREQNEKLTVLSSKILKAHEEERKRIAREIHDGPAQSAACLALKLELCKKQLEKASYNDLAGELDKLGGDIRSTVKEIRSIIYDLKPSYLDDGLFAALQNHIDVFRDNTGLKVEYSITGKDSDIEYYIGSTIFRIMQEALTNISKHARAKNVDVNIEVKGKELQLKVSDDGRGFDVEALRQQKHAEMERGFGIEGMMERVELINGSISIDSAIDKGTVIDIRVPLN